MLYISACNDNTHVNNLLESTSTNNAYGWTISCEMGVWDPADLTQVTFMCPITELT